MQTDIRLIPLTQGFFAICDACDYDFLIQFKWYLSKVKTSLGYYYRAKRHGPAPNWKNISMHREIAKRAGLPEAREYDHKDRNSLNNTRENIRPCNRSQNNANQGKKIGTSSKYKGVTWDKRKNKWMAKIQVDGKTIFLSYFTTEEAAARAYDIAAIQLFGEFARLNFP